MPSKRVSGGGSPKQKKADKVKVPKVKPRRKGSGGGGVHTMGY